MLQGNFAMCHHIDQRMEVMEQHMQIVRHNQEFLNSQQDEPLLEFLNVPIYAPIPDTYASLTPVELAAFAIGPTRAPVDNDDDEEEANDDGETEDNR
jgi:hypothetical protein